MKKNNYIVFGVLALALATFQSPKMALADDIVLPTVLTVSYDTPGGHLRGNLTDMGGASVVTVGFELGTTTAYGTIINNSVPTMTTTGEWTEGPSISCSATYHFRAFATNDAGTAYGDDMSFTTPICPYPQTNTPTLITETDVTLNGTLLGFGFFAPSFDVYFEYGTMSDLSSPTSTPTVTLSSPGTFSAPIAGLSCGTVYYFRAVSTDGFFVHPGGILSFVTCPMVVAYTPNVITQTQATLAGDLFLPPGITIPDSTISFEYGTTTAYGSDTTFTMSLPTGGGFGGTIDFACGTSFHYRAVVDNDTTGILESNDISFATLPCSEGTSPVVTTVVATNITQTGATLNGNVVSLGSESAILRQFQWGTSSDYTNGLPELPTPSSEIGPYSETLTGLTCNTTYYVRLRGAGQATNGYGEDMTFTTLPCTSFGGGGSPKLICDIDGDLNKDCTVDVLDYVLLMSMWGKVETGNIADLNQDTKVDALDLVVLMFNWSK